MEKTTTVSNIQLVRKSNIMVQRRWTDRLTSGLEPLLVEASKTGASHVLVICLVSQPFAEEERRKAVAVVRRHQQELRESVMGCLVVKAAQGWL